MTTAETSALPPEPSLSVPLDEQVTFADLGLSDKVLQAVTSAGYTKPTPIQSQAIPHILQHKDVLGIAQTGTGKTAAFTLPMITLLEKGRARARMPRTLILEPTRELAAQVEENFNKYGINNRLSVALLIGGMSFGDQDVKITRGVDVLIATPGRLLDHHERGKLLLTGVELLVIDEADRMLDMGFIPDIERICKLVPFTRQTLFFTATMPPEIQRITEQFLHNPVKIEASRPSTASITITQRLVASGGKDFEKRETLRGLINDAKDLKNAIVFCNRKSEVDVVHRSLLKHGFSVVALHGDMDQRARLIALDSFRKGDTKLLVASDVAARGLDIPDVSHVFNYDVPHHPEDYVHRIGRTGRAGRLGDAVMIMTGKDDRSLAAIEKLIGQKIAWDGPDLSALPASTSDDRPDRSSSDRSSSGRSSSGRSSSGRRGGRQEASSSRSSRPRTQEKETRSSPRTERRPPSSDMTSSPEEQNSVPAPARHLNPSPQRPRYKDEDDGPAVIGLGDHVPAFLMRPVSVPQSSPESNEPISTEE